MKKIDREHLANLLEWMFDEIFAARGDGGANLVIKQYNIHDIHLFISDYFQKKIEASQSRAYDNRVVPSSSRYGQWSVGEVKEGSQKVGQSFTVASPPEQCLLVTTNISNVPPWEECIVIL